MTDAMNTEDPVQAGENLKVGETIAYGTCATLARLAGDLYRLTYRGRAEYFSDASKAAGVAFMLGVI